MVKAEGMGVHGRLLHDSHTHRNDWVVVRFVLPSCLLNGRNRVKEGKLHNDALVSATRAAVPLRTEWDCRWRSCFYVCNE